jgi:hypothetical protein
MQWFVPQGDPIPSNMFSLKTDVLMDIKMDEKRYIERVQPCYIRIHSQAKSQEPAALP